MKPIEVHDRNAETRTDPACQCGLAGAAGPKDENALRHGHLLPSFALTCILVCLISCHSTNPRTAITCSGACSCGSKTQRVRGNKDASATRRPSREDFRAS